MIDNLDKNAQLSGEALILGSRSNVKSKTQNHLYNQSIREILGSGAEQTKNPFESAQIRVYGTEN